jgi:hypothetical protein
MIFHMPLIQCWKKKKFSEKKILLITSPYPVAKYAPFCHFFHFGCGHFTCISKEEIMNG